MQMRLKRMAKLDMCCSESGMSDSVEQPLIYLSIYLSECFSDKPLTIAIYLETVVQVLLA
jgi:hypothetical protein